MEKGVVQGKSKERKKSNERRGVKYKVTIRQNKKHGKARHSE